MAKHEHEATISWTRDATDFAKGRFAREHTWRFDGGATVAASASPLVLPFADKSAVDPEEALVAATASCHMLTFLHEARKRGFQVESYEDRAVGAMAPNERGVPWVATITLHPRIVYGGERAPTPEEEAQLHHAAHDGCFVAQSIRSEVKVEPTSAG